MIDVSTLSTFASKLVTENQQIKDVSDPGRSRQLVSCSKLLHVEYFVEIKNNQIVSGFPLLLPLRFPITLNPLEDMTFTIHTLNVIKHGLIVYSQNLGSSSGHLCRCWARYPIYSWLLSYCRRFTMSRGQEQRTEYFGPHKGHQRSCMPMSTCRQGLHRSSWHKTPSSSTQGPCNSARMACHASALVQPVMQSGLSPALLIGIGVCFLGVGAGLFLLVAIPTLWVCPTASTDFVTCFITPCSTESEKSPMECNLCCLCNTRL